MVKDYHIRPYQKKDYSLWNDFIGQAKNATFLFHRDFIEYHSDRFDDFSLLIFDDEKLVALLPANRVGNVLYSHQGLSYGGLVLSASSKLISVVSIYRSLLFFLHQNGIQTFQIKQIPTFYTTAFSDELNYCLFLTEAKLRRTDVLSVIDLSSPLQISKGRMEGCKKGLKNNLVVREESSLESFWNQLLIPNLASKHGVKPVHTLEEIQYLKNQFPNNIRQFNIYDHDTLVAGTTLFIDKNTVHTQYISGNDQKNELGSLDLLHYTLLTDHCASYRFFDFGISNENNGRSINEGLLFWKESFGAKTITQSFYEVETKNYSLTDSVLL